MNDLKLPSNDIGLDERPPNPDQRLQEGAGTAAPDLSWNRDSSRREHPWRVTVAIIFGFWVLQYAGTTALVLTMDPSDSPNLYVPRALVSLAGVVISFGMVAVQNRLRGSSLSTRAAVAAAMALIAPFIHFFVNLAVFDWFLPRTTPGMDLTEIARDYLWRLWIFASVSSIILALSYAAEIREREKSIQLLQGLAHSAQMRALRNQLSPHFLFNVLNSITGLISAKRVGEAETMTENLADFLRLTLALDPQKLITLDEELLLQGLYLDIEKARFPDRLKVTVDVPPALRNALVPSLITQPLIENSIKYAVARSTCPVELRILAASAGGMLKLTVADSGGDAEYALSKGARLGLRNVDERVHLHYGDCGRFHAEADSVGGFRNVIDIPLELRQ